MDFKSILSKLSSFEAPAKSVEGAKLADPIRLDESTELRVLAGVTPLTESVIAEKAVSKAQQKFMGMVHAAKKGEKPASPEVAKAAKGMSDKEAKKFASTKHKGLPEKKKKDEAVEEGQEQLKKAGDSYKTAKGGTVTKTATGIKHTKGDYSDEPHQEEPKKKASKAGMTGAERRAQKAQDKEQAKQSKDYEKKYPGSVTRHKMKEAAKPDFLDVDKDGDKKEPMKKAAAEKGGKKGMSAKQAKYFGKKESVKESALSFKQALSIVKESQGQLQIDPTDKALWSWAERVGKSKFTESIKAQAFAAATYEKLGGEWNLHKIIKE